MSNQILKDRVGNKIGEIRDHGHELVIHDKVGNKLGSYNPQSNITKDKVGNKVGTGNLLTSLLKS